MDPGPLSQLLARVDEAPGDVTVRERAARGLLDAGRHDEAVSLLTGALTHFNAHDPGALPCLCRRCIATSGASAHTGGRSFARDFAVASGARRAYVLFFWLPEDLRAQADRVRSSVAQDLAQRIRR